MNILKKKQALLKSFLFIFVLSAIINARAMEEISFDNASETNNTDSVVETMYDSFSKEPARLKTSLSDQDIVNLIYYDLSNKIDAILTSTPKTFYDAVVRLQCIAKILEKSEIAPSVLEKKLTMSFYEFQITNKDRRYLPYHLLPSTFHNWIQKAHIKIYLEHPKSIEAITIILNALNKNVTLQNLEKYKQALATLPYEAEKYVEEKFIEKYGWKIEDPEIELDDNGNIVFIDFILGNFWIRGIINNATLPSHIAVNEIGAISLITCPYGKVLDDDTSLAEAASIVLRDFFQIHVLESEVSLSDFLATKPTFERVLINHAIKQAKEYEKTLLGRVKINVRYLTTAFTNLFF